MIAGAVNGNASTATSSHADIDNNVMTWFRGAADRNGGRKKREDQKRQSLQSDM